MITSTHGNLPACFLKFSVKVYFQVEHHICIHGYNACIYAWIYARLIYVWVLMPLIQECKIIYLASSCKKNFPRLGGS